MTINLISDIHCKHKVLPPHFQMDNLVKADVLVIAGDIGEFPERQKVIDGIVSKYQGVKFEHLVYVWGNHDYYITDKHWLKYHPHSFVPPSKTDNSVKLIGDVAFICSPMWTKIYRQSFISISMNDYNYIPNFTTQLENELFDYNSNWIIERIKRCKADGFKTVVVTHHAPHPDCIQKEYEFHPLNEAFYCLEQPIIDKFMEAEPDLWLYGHSHTFDDRVIGKTRFVRNPFGYDWGPGAEEYKTSGFKYNNIIEI